ncbi:hypothetical protein HanLR1_Chr07g0253201 [Helianthus annuus]|nr:hypothetical protein HanLR1_Chr07g0253201 [Helianthus annuus]
MSDKWPERCEYVPVLLHDGEEVALYQNAFPAFAGTMGVRPLRGGEEYWFEQIKPNFLYARTKLFAAPPAATEGARIPKPRPCRAITFAGKEIVYLSSEESVASSEHELKPSYDVFAGVLRDLGVEHEEKRLKRVAKKKVTVAGGTTSKKTETAGAAFRCCVPELLASDRVGSPRAAWRLLCEAQEARALRALNIEELEAELIRKNALKRSRAETKTKKESMH